MNFGCAGEFLLGDCGFRINHTVNLYISPDLSKWNYRDLKYTPYENAELYKAKADTLTKLAKRYEEKYGD